MIVCLQLAAFARVSECREESRVKARMKRKRTEAKLGALKNNGKVVYVNSTNYAIGVKHGLQTPKPEDQEDGSFGPDPRLWHLEASDEDSTKTSDSETIL